MDFEDRIIAALNKSLGRKTEIKLESRLKEDLLCDSFDTLMIISALEDEFSIEIDEGNFSDIITVKDIVHKLRSAID